MAAVMPMLLRHFGEHVRGAFHACFHGVHLAQFVPQAVQLFARSRRPSERLHITAVSFFSGNASRGGMRLREIPGIAKIGHDVPDGCGA